MFHPSTVKINHCDQTSNEWHHSCGTLQIVPSQQSRGLGPPRASPSPYIPLEPNVLLGIPHIIFKQSFALRSLRSPSLYLYSETLATPPPPHPSTPSKPQCCFNSCYCCFSIDGVLCLLSPTCSVLLMGRSTVHGFEGLLFMSTCR